ncbi:hypothetical protein ACT3S4_14210 [Psychrobacter sp. AOP30-A2-5]|uniref:hypothetical protein n=1 Tax=Psychrobacter sp. AOP30-A2-5 TaxID=3457697 RepID=UPI0040364605
MSKIPIYENNTVDRQLSTYNDAKDLSSEGYNANDKSELLSKAAVSESIKDFKSERRSIDNFFSFLKKISDREAMSLLHARDILENNSRKLKILNIDDYKILLIDYLYRHHNPIEEYTTLLSYKSKNFLPETYISWFQDNLRHSLFLAYLIESPLKNQVYTGRSELLELVITYLLYNINSFDHSYRRTLPTYNTFIVWEADNGIATGIIHAKSIYLKNRVENRQTKWIDVDNPNQINWIYDYLDRADNQHIILKDTFFPESIVEKYELILASLDVLSNVESPEIGTKNNKGFSLRSYILYSMKKAWDGQKSYEVKSKVSDGKIKVYKSNQSKLEALMAFSGVTANQFINNSIEAMYDELLVSNTKALNQGGASD